MRRTTAPAADQGGQGMYDAGLATIYDLIYRGRGKDYAAEAAGIARLVRRTRPRAASLLDVACGTGTHLRHFADEFDHVEGLDLSEDMLAIAKRRLPGVALHLDDMRSFRLDRTFDVVTCMFSSIGHMRTTAELDTASARLADHLVPGGVLVIEPWWFPGTFTPGYIGCAVFDEDGYSIARMSHSVRAGDVTRMRVHYLVADAESGVRHFTETIVITLFTQADYENALRKAGCDVTYIDGGPSGRGLFIAVRR